MKKIIVNGANGKMGRLLCDELSKEYKIIKADISVNKGNAMTLSDIKEKTCILVDFSHISALEDVINYGTTYLTPLIIGTTGQNECELKKIEEASKIIPIMLCKNFALGVNVLTSILEELSKNDFDTINIIETHHKEKVDFPSGTAKLFANSICKNSKYVYDISDYNSSKILKNHINFHSIRSGNNFGEHSVIFASGDESIIISHIAGSREPFVKGVKEAVKFMENITIPGLYSFNDIKEAKIEK